MEPDIVSDYISECITVYENTTNKVDEKDIIRLRKWVGNNKTSNLYETVDDLFNNDVLSIDKIMFDPNNPCLFCNSKQSGLAAENDLAYASYDTYPVSKFHCLIIPKRHVMDYFDLNLAWSVQTNLRA